MGKPDADLLRRTAELAAGWLRSLDSRPVRATASVAELRSRLGGPLLAGPADPLSVVQALARAAEPGLVAIPSGRYFGFVIGGGLPAAVAADWLTTAWDQCPGFYACRAGRVGGRGGRRRLAARSCSGCRRTRRSRSPPGASWPT